MLRGSPYASTNQFNVDASASVPITGTHRDLWPGSTYVEPLRYDGDVHLTAWLRPARANALDARAARDLAQTPIPQRVYADRKSLQAASDADASERQAFYAFCAAAGIEVLHSHWRSAVISAPPARLVETFGATAALYLDARGHHFRQRSGALHASQKIADMLRGVFGLQQWPRSLRLGALSRHATPLSARETALRYNFPDADGAGQTIGIVQFRAQFRGDDFDRCMTAQGVTRERPVVKRVDSAAVEHELATTKDLEAALDAQIIAALAPGARIVIYEAPDDERGFLDAVRAAIFDDEFTPSILSISYGWPEFFWTPAALQILDDLFVAAALAGISVFCSSGDNGDESDYDGKPHVLAPASSPHVHACGATSIVSGTEQPWEKAGGGMSERFSAPPWQNAAMRAVPDVAAQQLPGYSVYLDATDLALGGTSAIAPVWAAFTARLNQRIGKAAGLFTPLLYHAPQGVFSGGTWNAHAGLGVPNGTLIEALLRGDSAPV